MARDYDPAVGRYVESDPIGLAGGLNTYIYVRNRPVQWMDKFGLVGCGSGWNESVVPDSPLGYPFGKCCDAHDDCYGNCKGPVKSTCDNNFHQCMLGSCRRYQGIARWVCEQLADIYFSAVDRFGQAAFDVARKACPACGKGGVAR
jgi:hypothetical protein